MSNQPIDYAKYIDHTLLKMDATEQEIIQVCKEALTHSFYSVCVNSGYVPLVAEQLAGSAVKTCSVIGFPLGAGLTAAKVAETQAATAAGADEIDMVINVGWLKSGNKAAVAEDIRQVNAAKGRACLKVILETCLLTQDEIREVCDICKQIGVDFVKTSTGFSNGGATISDVALMRKTVGDTMGVKASGGVRNRAGAQAMIDAGATRLGSSSGVAIVSDQDSGNNGY